jgi:flagellar basal-body rod protein FlgB
MDEIASALISQALEGLHQRYTFTAQNIANANSPDYRPARVSFEESLRVASQQGLSAIEAVRPQVAYEEAVEGEAPMRLDLELATASQTAARYRALIDILGREMAIHRTLITGGRS